MGRYILKRILQMVGIMVLVAVISFLLMEILPGDRIYMMLGDEISQEEYDYAYRELKLDEPVWVRFALWLRDAAKGDLGTSYQYKIPVRELIEKRIPISLYFAVMSMLISFPVGVLFGMIAAVRRGTKLDAGITLLANVMACIPTFWLGMLFLYSLSLKTNLFPAFGFYWPWEGFGLHIKHLIMPLTCSTLIGIAGITRQTRSSMLEVIRQDFVRTAYAKGLSESKVLRRHVFRNGLIPIVTMIGGNLAGLLGGSMFMESVFSIPGMGTLLVKSVTMRDMPVVQACVVITSLCSCVAFLITDLLYCVVDPRITLTGQKERN